MDTERSSRIDAIIDEARSWLYTPYHHKGRTKFVGVDCGGYVHCVYSKFFSLKPFPEYYPEDWALHAGQELYLDFIGPYVNQVALPSRGGLALFRFGRCYAHGAICTGGPKPFIHAYGRTGYGCVKEDKLSFFRYPTGKPREVKYFELKW